MGQRFFNATLTMAAKSVQFMQSCLEGSGEDQSMTASQFGPLNVLLLADFEDCEGLLFQLRMHCTLSCNDVSQALEGIRGGFVPDIICTDDRRASSVSIICELRGRFPGHDFVVMSLPFSQVRNSAQSSFGKALAAQAGKSSPVASSSKNEAVSSK